MKTVNIKLNTIQDVQSFVNAVTGYVSDVDLTSGRYTVNGKSIMGIFSLDLLNPIVMTVHGDDPDSLLAKLSAYIVE